MTGDLPQIGVPVSRPRALRYSRPAVSPPSTCGDDFMGNHRADRRGLRREPSESSHRCPRAAGAGPTSRPVTRASRARSSGRCPSTPVLVGVAALAVSAGGAVTAAGTDLVQRPTSPASRRRARSAAPATSPGSAWCRRPHAAISRDSRRDALADAADDQLVAEAEQQAQQHDAALAKLAQQAETQAAKIAPQPVGAAGRQLPPHRPLRRVQRPVGPLPHRPRLRRPHRHPDPRGRQRHRHLDRLRRLLRQQDRGHPRRRHRALVLPPERLRRQRRRRGPRRRA